MGSIFGIPGMLFWGAAAAIPILIHLFARQRYKKVPWAAMEFLLRAYKKTQRRIRLEHLLLLLLRILAILLFVLALADPKLNPGALVGGLDARREVVVILDTSYSMGLTGSDSGTAMSRAKGQIQKLLRGLHQDRGDTVTVITAGKPAALSIKGDSDLDRVQSVLDEIELGDGATDYLGAFRTTVAALADLQEGAEIYLFSDLQKVGFSPPSADGGGDGENADDKPQELLASLVSQMTARKAILHVVAPGDAPTDNITLTALEKKSKAVVTGAPAVVTATLRNYGTRPRGGVVRLFVDGGSEPVDFRDIDSIPPGGLHSVDFRHVFRSEGSHFVEARFVSDNLATDNRRGLALEVRRKIKTLIVDGDPAGEPSESESFFFSAAMSPGGEQASENEFELETVQEVAFEGKELKDVDLLVLMDVKLISSRRAEDIKRFVEEGGGLLIFLGDKTDPDVMNQRLWKGGSGVLPAELRQHQGGDALMEIPYGLANPDLDHPALAYFADPAVRVWLDAPPIYRYFQMNLPKDDDSVRVLAWIDRPSATLPKPEPLLVEKRTGKGKTILFGTSGGDRDWNEMQALPTYLLLARELSYYVTRREERHENLTVGQVYERVLKSFVREAVLQHDGEQLSVITPLALPENRGYEMKTPPLTKAGTYRLDLQRGGEEKLEDPNPIHVAANVDPTEGDLTRVDEGYINASFPGEGVRYITDLEGQEESVASQRDGRAWWWALLLGAAVLAIETALSQIFGLRAKRKSA